MGNLKTGTEAEWIELGERVKQACLALGRAFDMAGKLLPLKIYGKLGKAYAAIDDFRNHAENEMFRRGGPRNITVFYGAYDPAFDERQRALEEARGEYKVC